MVVVRHQPERVLPDRGLRRLNKGGRPFAAVAIVGPACRLTKERMLEIGPDLLATAQEMAEELALAGHI